MARIRTVKPEFWEDETNGSISRDARLMFLATFNLADDEGLLRWSPAYIKGSVFIYDDDLGACDVQRLMTELESSWRVFPYTVGRDHQKMCWVVNFRKHQKINRPQPGKLAPPSLSNSATVEAYMRRDKYECQLCHEPVNTRNRYNVNPYDGSAPNLESLNPSLDHIVPVSKGGSDYPTNIRLAHVGCNKGRGNRDDTEFSVPLSVQTALRERDNEVLKIHGGFTEDSLNDHGSVSERYQPETPLTCANTASVNIHGGFTEDSLTEGKGREGERKGREVVLPLRNYVQSATEKFADPRNVTNRIVNQWLDTETKRPPSKVINDATTQIQALTREGIDPADIQAGLTEWWAGKYPASTIPNYVSAAQNGRGQPSRTATTTQRATDILAIDTSTITEGTRK